MVLRCERFGVTKSFAMRTTMVTIDNLYDIEQRNNDAQPLGSPLLD